MPEKLTMPEYIFHEWPFSVGPIMLKFSRIVTTSIVAVAVLFIWRHHFEQAFETIASRFMSLFLVADVLFTPSLIPWREGKAGKKAECSVFEENGYRWLMLMAVLLLILESAHR